MKNKENQQTPDVGTSMYIIHKVTLEEGGHINKAEAFSSAFTECVLYWADELEKDTGLGRTIYKRFKNLFDHTLKELVDKGELSPGAATILESHYKDYFDKIKKLEI